MQELGTIDKGIDDFRFLPYNPTTYSHTPPSFTKIATTLKSPKLRLQEKHIHFLNQCLIPSTDGIQLLFSELLQGDSRARSSCSCSRLQFHLATSSVFQLFEHNYRSNICHNVLICYRNIHYILLKKKFLLDLHGPPSSFSTQINLAWMTAVLILNHSVKPNSRSLYSHPSTCGVFNFFS